MCKIQLGVQVRRDHGTRGCGVLDGIERFWLGAKHSDTCPAGRENGIWFSCGEKRRSVLAFVI